MDPMTMMSLVNLGIGATKGIAQIGTGIGQLVSNKKPEDLNYEIPEEVKQMLSMVMTRASNPFPQGDTMRAEVGQQLAGAVKSVNDIGGASGASLGAIADLYGKQLSSLNQISIQEDASRADAEKAVASALMTKANYQDRMWDFNVRQPYERALQEFYSKRSAGWSNVFGGIDELSGTGSSFFQNQMLMDQMGMGSIGGVK